MDDAQTLTTTNTAAPVTYLDARDAHLETVNQMLALPIERLAEMASAAMDALDGALAATGDDKPTPEQLENLRALVVATQDAMLQKPDNYVGFLRHLEQQAELCREEARRLSERRRLFENKHDRLEQRLLEFVAQQKDQRITTFRYTISQAKKPARVEVLDADALPEMFKTVVPETQEIIIHPAHTDVDERGVLALLKAGKAVEGARLVQEYRLSIR